MRIAVFGAGATGGHLAARLAAAGNRVSVVARGAHLAAIRARGLRLESGPQALVAEVAASDRPADLGPQEVVFVTVKAPALAGAAAALAPLVGPGTLLVFTQNGMPWWYPVGLAPGLPRPPDLPIFALAPGFLRLAGPERILGGVINSANMVSAPGVVRNLSPGRNRLGIGPLAPGGAESVRALRAALAAAGIEAAEPDDIRAEVWRKLMINMTASTLGLVTGEPSSVVRDDPGLGEIFARLVEEGLMIARAHGFELGAEIRPEALRAAIPAGHKPSILQDLEAGRPMEVAEIVLAPQAFARAAGLATPTLDVLAAIAARLARARGRPGPGAALSPAGG